ncbi:MAG: KEOPS complex subunit Cgi121 [Candidatus Micrarchaeota archaeon]
MLHAYVLETDRKKEEIIGLLKDYKAIAVRQELALLEEYAAYCLLKAKSDFKSNANVAKEFRMEWMCRLACTKNINKAIDFCQMESGKVGILSEEGIPEAVLEKIGRPGKKSGKGQKAVLDENTEGKICSLYSIPKNSLAKYGLQGLLREKSAVSFLE